MENRRTRRRQKGRGFGKTKKQFPMTLNALSTILEPITRLSPAQQAEADKLLAKHVAANLQRRFNKGKSNATLRKLQERLNALKYAK
jgi:hypothetical protein